LAGDAEMGGQAVEARFGQLGGCAPDADGRTVGLAMGEGGSDAFT